jgi:multimeric flavodoxin WrbA
MTDKPLVILASARKESDTRAFVNRVFAGTDHKLIDLLDWPVAPYNYSNNYPEEDAFLEIAGELLRHQVIVFATPVYWYAMSGLLKIFFDRFTDLVTTKKQIGRQLKGKSTLLLAVGADEELPDGFEIPFKCTSAYLDMAYRGCIYYSTGFSKTETVQKAIESFRAKLKNQYC